MPNCNIREEMRSHITDRALFDQVKTYAYEYMDSIFDKRVYPSHDAIKGLEAFNEPIPELPSNPSSILEALHKYGSPAAVAQTAGRYFGFVNGSSVRYPWLRNGCLMYGIKMQHYM